MCKFWEDTAVSSVSEERSVGILELFCLLGIPFQPRLIQDYAWTRL